MDLGRAPRITHIQQDEDALTIMFEDGRALLFTGIVVEAVIPKFILLTPDDLKKFDC